MVFYLKLLLMLVFLFSTNCVGESTEKKESVDQEDTTKVILTNAPLDIDSIDHLNYSWTNNIDPGYTIRNRINAPKSYVRTKTEKGSFADWLRNLPLKSDQTQVYLYNGQPKSNQSVHEAIVDIDVGNRDLQQCADAVMRLRSEYFYGKKDYSNIHFNFTSGDKVSFEDWMRGKKPVIDGNSVRFSNPGNTTDVSYSNFRKYMDIIFTYAGTASLSKEMDKIDIEDMRIGDIFIQGGFPGHAVIVVDMAENDAGQKCFLLAQSYMPAQEIHILKNFNDDAMSPWYPLDFDETLYTPEWTFTANDLKRFRN